MSSTLRHVNDRRDTGITVVWGWSNLPANLQGASVAMGTFDGVHKGHQAVIALAADAAERLQVPLAAITFNPLPKAYFRPGQPASRLMQIEQQAAAFEALGVEILYVLPMNELSNMTGETFARTVLGGALNARHVAVGFDNAFGRDRSGGPEALRIYGQELGFGVSVVPEVTDGAGRKFSSTAVREALCEGRPEEAAEILGRPFAIRGAVQRGRQLGRRLGFPTANIPLSDYVAPRRGVYATMTRLADGREIAGVANIGVKPTTGELAAPLMEVSLFDFDEDLYDQVVETQLIAFLRAEQTFETLDLLAAQIQRDAQAARGVMDRAANTRAKRTRAHLRLIAAES